MSKKSFLDELRDAVFDHDHKSNEPTCIVLPEVGVSLFSDGTCLDIETGEPASSDRVEAARKAIDSMFP